METFFTLSALGFYLLTLLGMIAHAAKKWINNEIDGHIFRWYMDNPKYTAGVVFAAGGTTLAGVAAGTYSNIHDSAQVLACCAVAFSIDSFNKQ